jgi:hypothetical protein
MGAILRDNCIKGYMDICWGRNLEKLLQDFFFARITRWFNDGRITMTEEHRSSATTDQLQG